LWLRSYSNLKAKCRPSKSDADHQLEGGKCTYGGHHQFLMNNSNNNVVCQFSYGRFNGTVHLLIEFVVVVLFKCKGKMSPPQVEIIADHYLEGGKYTHGGYHQFLMNNSSNNKVCLFKRCGVNGKLNLFIRGVVVELFKCKSKMSVLPSGNHCRSLAGGEEMHPWWTPPIPYEQF